MSANRGSIPENFEDVEFELVEENWNEYELQNGTKVRGRIIVTRFAKDPSNPDPNSHSINSQNIFVVTAPVEQRREPTATPLTPQEISNPQGNIVDILTNNERWNKYKLLRSGVILKVKLVVSDAIRLTDGYDKDHMPQYVFTSSPMIVPDRRQTPNSGT